MGLLLALLLAAGPSGTAAPAPAPPSKAVAKVAVLDVRAGPKVDAALSPYLTQVLASEVAARTGTAPLVSADIRALLGFEKARRSLGCDDDGSACIAEIGGALGVDEVVHTSLLLSESAGQESRYLLTSTRLDAHKARPLARDAQSIPSGDGAALELAVRRAAFRMFGGNDPGESPPPAPTAAAKATGAAAALPAAATGTEAASAGPGARRTAAWVTAGGAVALSATAAGFGFAALTAANAGSAGLARDRAHAADGLWIAAALAAGASVWLWVGERPAALVPLVPIVSPGGVGAVAALAF